MFRAALFFLLFFTSLICFASEPNCTKLADEAETSGIPYYPLAEAKVIGSGKVGFYSSPNAECRIKGIFVVKGNYLTAYKSYKGEDLIGCLPESKVKIVGQYGRNP